jgi:DNA-3-methyladenine glycosylase I
MQKKARNPSPRPKATRVRCPWAGTDDALYLRYHDLEWGVPVHDDRKLFEMLILEGAQAGLSWITILRKREAYRAAFAGFEPSAVARFTSRDRARLLANEGIVRNRAKVAAAIGNASAFLAVQEELGSFDAYLWRFVGGVPVQHRFRSMRDVPPKDTVAEALSKDLKKRGFKFVGPTIMYAFMQAVGMVNDHLVTCFRHAEITKRW